VRVVVRQRLINLRVERDGKQFLPRCRRYLDRPLKPQRRPFRPRRNRVAAEQQSQDSHGHSAAERRGPNGGLDHVELPPPSPPNFGVATAKVSRYFKYRNDPHISNTPSTMNATMR